MSKIITQSIQFKDQKAAALYEMYLDSKKHALLTAGGTAKISAKEGSAFKVWGGYIHGKNLLLIKHKLIVQSWIAADWENLDIPSILILVFRQEGPNAIIEMTHSGVPAEHWNGIKKGWTDFYWKPWKSYLKMK